MSKKRHDTVLLNDMIEYANKALTYVAGMDFKTFYETSIVMDATIRCLEVIGEACRQMDKTTQARYPDIPWHRIQGLRNRVVHEYADVDLETVWRVTQQDLPTLLPQLKAVLQAEEE